MKIAIAFPSYPKTIAACLSKLKKLVKRAAALQADHTAALPGNSSSFIHCWRRLTKQNFRIGEPASVVADYQFKRQPGGTIKANVAADTKADKTEKPRMKGNTA